jgi:hypothetical protein
VSVKESDKHLRKQFKGGTIYFGSRFQRLQLMVAWLCDFGPEEGSILWWWEHVEEVVDFRMARRQTERQEETRYHPQ